MLNIVNFVGLIVKQGEKALNDPSDLKDTDIRTIVTGYEWLPESKKVDEVAEIYAVMKAQFEERELDKLPGFGD